MSKIGALLRASEKYLVANSPSVLTGLAVVGVATTAVLTGKASFKAAEIIREDEFTYGTAGDAKERFKSRARLTWRLYIPPAVSGAVTIVAVVGANRIGTRRAAAIAAAYTISEKAFEDYRAKIVEKFGKGKERDARDELAQEYVTKNPPRNGQIVITNKGDVLFLDRFSGRYFETMMEDVKAAQNHVNHRINNFNYASLNDFYDRLGLDRIPMGEELGWNIDRLLEINFSTTMSDDSRPAIVIEFHTAPISGYYRLS